MRGTAEANKRNFEKCGKKDEVKKENVPSFFGEGEIKTKEIL